MTITEAPVTLNRDLLYAIAAEIENHPESHDQSDWGRRTLDDRGACGTTYCIAGWAVALTVPPERQHWNSRGALIDVTIDGHVMSVADYAAEVLGFDGHWTLYLPVADGGTVWLFGGWEPVEGLTVPDVLRGLGDGVDSRLLLTHWG